MINVAGHQDPAGLQDALRAQAARMQAAGHCVFLPHSSSALRLRDASTTEAYDLTFAELLHFRNHVDPQAFHVVRRSGVLGGLLAQIRMLLWRVLRYQHERMFFRQNLINSHFTALLEAQGRRHAAEAADLRARVAALEQSGSDAPVDSGKPGIRMVS